MTGVMSVFAIATTAALVALAFGIFVGYCLGLRARIAPVVTPAAVAPQVNAPSPLANAPGTVDAFEEQSRQVSELAKKHRDSVPPEMMMAIDQLIAVATKAGQQLRQITQSSNDAPTAASEPAGERFAKPKMTTGGAARQPLTGEEMRGLTQSATADDSE